MERRSDPLLLRDLVACITLSAICLVPVYKTHANVDIARLNYYRPAPYSFFMSGVTLALILALGLVFICVVWLVRRATPRTQQLIFAGSPLLLIPVALDVANNSKFAMISVAVLIAAAAAMAYSAMVGRALASVLLAFSLLVPIQVAMAVWNVLTQPPASKFLNRSRSHALAPSNPAKSRVVWMIFDEWDDELTFALRPKNAEMPALDRLRSESMYVSGAVAAAPYTLDSIPSMLLGRRLTKVRPSDFKTLQANYGKKDTSVWDERSTVFSDAKAAGLRTAIVGWYHPYCRVLDDTVDFCESYLPVDARASFRDEALMRHFGVFGSIRNTIANRLSRMSVGKTLGIQRAPMHYIFRVDRGDIYRKINAHALALASDPAMGFVFIHWNIPHTPGIYDRTENHFASTDDANYFDNLELVDVAIGQAREAMTRAGLWDTTTLIVTSDHPMRTELWESAAEWTPEEAKLTHQRSGASVPFFIKLAGQKDAVTIRNPFQVVRTRELISEIRTGKVRTHADVISWILRE
jgi:hypothetical protein